MENNVTQIRIKKDNNKGEVIRWILRDMEEGKIIEMRSIGAKALQEATWICISVRLELNKIGLDLFIRDEFETVKAKKMDTPDGSKPEFVESTAIKKTLIVKDFNDVQEDDRGTFVVMVANGSDCCRVGTAITKGLQTGKKVEVRSICLISLNQATKACIMANRFMSKDGKSILVQDSFEIVHITDSAGRIMEKTAIKKTIVER